MNILFFRQLKWEKEGLCVYAVLRVNLFIAPWAERERVDERASQGPSPPGHERNEATANFSCNSSLLEVLNS